MRETFPDIYRYQRSELAPRRLWIAGLTLTAVAVLLFASTRSPVQRSTLLGVLLYLEGLILFYGASRVAISIPKERDDKTWDFQRLTPLRGWEIALGKLLGAPVLAFFLSALLVPWVLAAGLTGGTTVSLGDALFTQIQMAAGAFAVYSGALLVSAHSPGKKISPLSMIAILVFLLYVPGLTMSALRAGSSPFFGADLPGRLVFFLTALAFGGWMLAGAVWRLGQDLREPRRFWRLPAFQIFLLFYLAGFYWSPKPGDHVGYLLLGPVSVAFVAALSRSERADYWRAWLAPENRDLWWDDMPLWITGLLSLAGLAALGALVGAAFPDFPGRGFRPLILVPLFVARDLFFLQWCRFTRSRSPEVMAILYLAIAYIVPSAMAAFLGAKGSLFLFLPVVNLKVNIMVNLLPGLAQASLALGALRSAFRRAVLDRA